MKISDEKILELLKYVQHRKYEISDLIIKKTKQGFFNENERQPTQYDSSTSTPFYNNTQTMGCIIACHEFLSNQENKTNLE